jgi:pimeloyl-ACP methyl ester carboxylesterase
VAIARRSQAVRLGTGVTVSYVAQGDPAAVPVVLLHAWGESAGCFDQLLPLLPTTVHAMALDQRGHGAAETGAIPGARLVAYPGTGHLVLWEQPERVASDLTEFVVGLPAGRW